MRFLSKFILYLFVGFYSFLFFLYLTFPYQVLKERIANSVSKETKSLVSIKSLDISFPLGLKFDKVRIYRPGVGDLKIKNIQVQVSFLSLLFGSVKSEVILEDFSDGSLSIESHFSLSALLSEPRKSFPSYLSFNADNFNLASPLNYFVKLKSGEKTLNPMIKSALRDIFFIGKVNSKSFFVFDEKDYSNSKGKLNIQFVNAGLDLLSLPYQSFKVATIQASLNRGVFKFDPKTELASEGLKVGMSGSIKQEDSIMKSKIDITLKVDLFSELKENFSMILDMLTNKTSGGSIKVRFKGPLGSPKVDIF